MKRLNRILLIVGIVISMFIITGYPCYADGITYHGCYQKSSGILKVVADPSECKSQEIPISWNETGPQGPTGNTGATGPAGPPGLMDSSKMRWEYCHSANFCLCNVDEQLILYTVGCGSYTDGEGKEHPYYLHNTYPYLSNNTPIPSGVGVDCYHPDIGEVGALDIWLLCYKRL
jgi:hypothetical protein